MDLKLKSTIMSHLSDVQTGLLTDKDVQNRLNFVKYLIQWSSKHNHLNEYINPDKEWEDFTKTKYYKP